jgi:hypothetical protein
MVVVHADYVDRLLLEAPSPEKLLIVSARADRARQLYADFEIVQNASSVEEYQFFIPSWVQPGLIPRNASRGTRVERVAYVGARKQLHDDLADPHWADALRQRGLSWDLRMITFSGNDQLYTDHRWNDYSTTDIVVALRPPDVWNASSKPAAKLQNAWAAGTPAILSPEMPYRELRRSDLDYLEARNGGDVLAAIERLRFEPGLFAAIVQNGFARAREFQPDRIVVRWAETLWREIPARSARPGVRLLARVRSCRALGRRIRRRLAWRRDHPSITGDRQPALAGSAIQARARASAQR